MSEMLLGISNPDQNCADLCKIIFYLNRNIDKGDILNRMSARMNQING